MSNWEDRIILKTIKEELCAMHDSLGGVARRQKSPECIKAAKVLLDFINDELGDAYASIPEQEG